MFFYPLPLGSWPVLGDVGTWEEVQGCDKHPRPSPSPSTMGPIQVRNHMSRGASCARGGERKEAKKQEGPWRQPKYPPTDERTEEMWHQTHHGGVRSSRRGGDADTGYDMDGPEDTVPGESSQSQRDKHCMILFTWGSQSSQTECRLTVAGAWGRGARGYCSVGRFSWGRWSRLGTDRDDGRTAPWMGLCCWAGCLQVVETVSYVPCVF